MGKYPKLIRCQFSGVLKLVHSEEEERAFHRQPLIILGGSIAVLIVYLTLVAFGVL